MYTTKKTMKKYGTITPIKIALITYTTSKFYVHVLYT
jgi:hypothetical protein